MTLLTIVKKMAKNVGVADPDQVVGSTNRSMVEALSLANTVGEELARRVDWGALQAATTLTGDGTNKTFTLPAYFSRLSPGVTVSGSGGILRPLTRAEWNTLTAVQGTPRYFLLEGSEITVWPYLANAATLDVSYQTKAWCSNGTDAWSADDNTSLVNEDVFVKGLIVAWRRQKGLDYADFEAEYEATLQNLANFDERARF